MDPWKRRLAKLMLRTKLSELHGQAFEEFFHCLMQCAHPGFFPVRTQGSLGDLGADGIAINDHKLYACYGPQVFDKNEVKRKFARDLAKALEKRPGEFDTFVFVHNDLRGVAAEVTQEIKKAEQQYSGLRFESFGLEHMYRLLRSLSEEDVEDLLGPFPAREMVTGAGMEDLAPLLEHLAENRPRGAAPERIDVPPAHKLDYNDFSLAVREHLRVAMRYVPLVEHYYAGRNDPVERDEAARGFSAEYQWLEERHDDPDTIVGQLLEYILGNEFPSLKKQVNAQVVLMYFFGECEIFKVPPPDWRPGIDTYTGATE